MRSNIITVSNLYSADENKRGNIAINSYTNEIYINDGVYCQMANPCSEISLNTPENAFETFIPDIREIEEMCREYPGLDKAYENFKTFYKLVEQDWRGKQKNKKS